MTYNHLPVNIDKGQAPGDGRGEPVRSAFVKVEAAVNEIFDRFGPIDADHDVIRTRILRANSYAPVSTASVKKTLMEAVTALQGLPMLTPHLRGVIYATGDFLEQIDLLPADRWGIHIWSPTSRTFNLGYYGPRPEGMNFCLRLGRENIVSGFTGWLTQNEDDIHTLVEDFSRYSHLENYRYLSAPPPGGDVVVQGLGRCKAIVVRGSDWQKTFTPTLGWIDCDRSGAGAAIEIEYVPRAGVSIPAEPPDCDVRFMVLNGDAMHVTTIGGAVARVSGVTGVFFQSVTLFGNISSANDRALIVERGPYFSQGRVFTHLTGGVGIPAYAAPVEVRTGATLVCEHQVPEGSVPVVLVGDGEVTYQGLKGEIARKASLDAYSVRNIAGGASVGQLRSGDIQISIPAPAGVSPPQLMHVCRPVGTGAINGMVRIEASILFVDEKARAGLVMKATAGPDAGKLYFFGVRGGRELCLELWTNETAIATADVVPPREVRDMPDNLGVFRDGAGLTRFEVRDPNNGFVHEFASIAGLSGFSALGFGGSTQNDAGAGFGLSMVLTSMSV